MKGEEFFLSELVMQINKRLRIIREAQHNVRQKEDLEDTLA